MSLPEVRNDELNAAIRDERIEDANKMLVDGVEALFSGTDFRAIKLCGLNAEGQDFSNSYFRLADMRGLDLRTCNMEGASLHGAVISGVYFPPELDAGEIQMSVKYGTRLRYKA